MRRKRKTPLNPTGNANQTPGLLDARGVGEILGVSLWMVYCLHREGSLPAPFPHPGRLRWRLQDLVDARLVSK